MQHIVNKPLKAVLPDIVPAKFIEKANSLKIYLTLKLKMFNSFIYI